VLADLLDAPTLCAALVALLPAMRAAGDALRLQFGDEPALLRVAQRLAELDAYVSCVDGLGGALDACATLRSAGLCALREAVATARAAPAYAQLAALLPELRTQLEAVGSVTIGVNLDGQFRPDSATLLAINSGRFHGRAGLLERLLGSAKPDDARGVSPLYRAEAERSYSAEHALYRDLSHTLEQVVAPIMAVLDRYKQLSSRTLAALEPELAFFLGAARLITRLRASGLALCRPEVAPVAARRCQLVGAYCLDLALRLLGQGDAAAPPIVANEVCFDDEARLLLLTGPNSGGKTTYTRTIGQAQVLFQAGLWVPGERASISPVDGVYSHFATAERPDQEGGRLAEELMRLAAIFQAATPQSLLLLNEPFTSTDYAAARTLARDLLAGLRLLGARALCVTHMHEVVEEAVPVGASYSGVASLVAGVSDASSDAAPVPTFRVARGRPQPLGYARELARRYGLSREQIAQTLRERGLVEGDTPHDRANQTPPRA
jgi:DNA mismatch repair protein MutS